MKPIRQTKFTPPDQSRHGNCLAACIASLIECDLSAVPPVEDYNQSWFSLLFDFLAARGYRLSGTMYPEGDIHEWWPRLLARSGGVDGHFLCAGPSPRSWVTRGHVVIYKDGEMVHDPHFSGDGLLSIEQVLLIEPIHKETPNEETPYHNSL